MIEKKEKTSNDTSNDALNDTIKTNTNDAIQANVDVVNREIMMRF